MLLLFALSCFAAAAFGSVVVYQRGAAQRLSAADGVARLPPKSEQPPREEPTLETLQTGDVVLDGDDDYVVAGCVSYREEQEQWQLFVLDAGKDTRFLEVRRDKGVLGTALLDAVDDAPMHGRTGDGLTYRAKPHALELRGDARVSVLAETAGRSAGLLKYARYAGPGGALLVLEEEGEARRAYAGRRMQPSAWTIYPHA